VNAIIRDLLALQELELGRKKAEAEAQIARLRESIPAPILGHYDRLMVRGKKGVSLVRHGVCCECHMRVAIGTLATLKRGEDVQLCDTCGRYLFLVEEAPPAAEVAAPAAPPAAPRKPRKPRKTPNAQ
jgi:predicted  nucleic acid-binding Zn-ribbon protein